MGTDQQAHRAGALVQKNKTHKTGRHRSKGAIDNDLKGKCRMFCKQYLLHVIGVFPFGSTKNILLLNNSSIY